MDDLLQGVKDFEDEMPGDGPAASAHPPDFQMPTQEQLLQMLEHMDMSEEDKEEIKKNLMNPKLMSGLHGAQYDRTGLIIIATCILILVFIFAFFGYKLYRSVTEKERKREEKKRQKEQKKKHK